MAVLDLTVDLSHFAGFGFDQASAEEVVREMIGDEIAGGKIVRLAVTLAPADKELTQEPEGVRSTRLALTLIVGGRP